MADRPFKVGDIVVAVKETSGWGEVKPQDIGIITSAKDQDHLYADFKEQQGWMGQSKCFRHWEDIEEIGMASKSFKVGDRVRRVTVTHTGSYGTSEQGKEYEVLTADSNHVGIFKTKGGKPEGACWSSANFEMVEPAPVEPFDWDIVDDIEFGGLNNYKKAMVLKGYQWLCSGCSASRKDAEAALRCCGKDTVNYVEMPDYLWYSTSKETIVHIQDMMPPHLKAAILKLRKEKDRNPLFHLLPALENEAFLRNMDI